eukprot:s2769_g20.t1
MARKCAIAKLALAVFGGLATTFQAQTPCFQLSGRPLPLATSKVPQPPGKRDLPLATRKAGREAERAQRDSERAKREAERAQLDSERAQRESNKGRTQAAADRMMEPFTPQKKKAEVVRRGIMEAIRQRILCWDEHATIIAGRFGAGKSVAVEDALRGMQGVFVHQVDDNDWKEQLFGRLGLDGPDMLEEVLRRVGGKLNRPPVLVLEIPRTAKRGWGRWGFRFPLLLALLHSEAWIRFPASPRICRRTGSWPTPGPEDSAALFRCAADEAEKLLELHGQEDRKDEFLDACPYAALFALFCRETHPALSGQPLNPLGGYKAMDLASTCQRCAKVGEEALQAKKADMDKKARKEALQAKKADMDKKARKEVLRFKDQCKIAGDTGKEILEELLANRQAGKGADELCTPLHLRRMWRCGSASGVITP